jgi:hypothetical protein
VRPTDEKSSVETTLDKVEVELVQPGDKYLRCTARLK